MSIDITGRELARPYGHDEESDMHSARDNFGHHLLRAHRLLDLARARVNRIVELQDAGVALARKDLVALSAATRSIDMADGELCYVSKRH